MTRTNSFSDPRDLLVHLGYHESSIQNILHELDILFQEIGFNELKQTAYSAQEAKDTAALISSLKELMLQLENKGCYRPDYPTKLIKLLVNGLNHKNEDIFALLEKASIPEKDKMKEQEFLASCAAITQLGYILLRCLVSEVKAASAGPHVFLAIDGLYPDAMIFVDFSIDSIMEINTLRYNRKENNYHLKNTEGLDNKTSALLDQYYSFFQLTRGIGLSHNIHNNLGITYDRLGRYEEALEELKTALRLNPGYIEVHNNLAVTYDKMGKREESLRQLHEALRLNPAYAEAHSNLGNLFAKSGRYEEATEELKQALRFNPGYAIAHNSLGHIYALQNKNQEAVIEFREALRLDPDYAPAHSNLGSIFAELGKYEEALKEFQEALRLDAESPEVYHGIGSVYYSLGSYERAAQALIRAVYLDPEILECVPEKLLLKVRQGVSRSKEKFR
ncbi:MAG: tetratricopeptide repeat protein [Euryarchaeota archaeon]|nr:tetratricopeptide repeat protein [Euryarchaeota archaeon]